MTPINSINELPGGRPEFERKLKRLLTADLAELRRYVQSLPRAGPPAPQELDDETEHRIVTEGFGELSDQELEALSRNPTALAQLHLAIEFAGEEVPTAFLDAFAEHGEELAEAAGIDIEAAGKAACRRAMEHLAAVAPPAPLPTSLPSSVVGGQASLAAAAAATAILPRFNSEPPSDTRHITLRPRALHWTRKAAVWVLATGTLGLLGVVAVKAKVLSDENSLLNSNLLAKTQRVQESQKEIAELTQRLARAQRASPLPQSEGEMFRHGFEQGRQVRLRTDPNKPGLISLVFDPFLQPPYYNGLQEVLWDGKQRTEPKTLFWAGRVPLAPVLTHDFTSALPSSGERRVDVLLFYHTTGEAMEKLKVGPVVVVTLPLILTHHGIRTASPEDKDLVIASIDAPADGQTVSDSFKLEFTLRRPSPTTGPSTVSSASPSTDSSTASSANPPANAAPGGVVYVLVRPLNGSPRWQQQYYVVPFFVSLERLGDTSERYWTWVSLPSLLDLDAVPPEQRPTRFELLVVELPCMLQGWTTPKSLMDLDDPKLAPQVRARCQVVTPKPQGEQQGEQQ